MANTATGSCNATRGEYTDSAGSSTAAPASAAAFPAAPPAAGSRAQTAPASSTGCSMANLENKIVLMIENKVNNQTANENQAIVSWFYFFN
jgi:hypothetical protein